MAARYDAADVAPYGMDSADTLVLTIPNGPVQAIPAGWYPDPSWRERLRYWDGQSWSELTSPVPVGDVSCLADGRRRREPCARAGRKSPLLAFVLVFFFGPLGMFYLSALSGVVALLVGLALWQLLGWLALLTYPLMWFGSLVYAPVAVLAANSRRLWHTGSAHQ